MTVAAVLIGPGPSMLPSEAAAEFVSALTDVAWAGGATPIVVVVPDPEGIVAAVVADRPASMLPVERAPHGAVWFVRGMVAATELVRETTAVFLWPVRYRWIDAETVTSLIEAHGADPAALVRPAFRGEPGFPALVPVAFRERLEAMATVPGGEALDRLVAEGVPLRIVELGDPGIVHDASTPRDQLPPFEGPPEPAGGPPPDWNEALGQRAVEPDAAPPGPAEDER